MFDDEREGYRWSLEDEEDRKHLLEYTDQFKPFQDIVGLVCDCAWEKIISEQYFKGTLFRFPLRSEASEISDNLYDSLKVEQLFDSFIADAKISLLFLRNVTSISLMHIDTNGTDVTMKVSVSSSSPLPQESEAHDFQREYVEGVTSFKTVCCVSPSEPETKTKWLVTTCLLMEGCVPEIDTLADKLSFHPQVDVAFQCDEIKTGVTGRLSCFLPLPNNETNNTGLPVNVNACFGLTDNRRYIKWQEEDQKNDESAMWNELLKKEVLPHVYLKIIQDAIQFSRKSMLPASTVYSLWPDLSKTEQRDRWHEVAMEVYKQLFTGKDIFSLAANEESWVAASEAVFPTNNTDTDTMSAVARLLIAERENLVTVPEHVLKAIQRAFPEPATLQWVTPCFVRTVLRKTEIGNVSKDDKLSLLEYVLSDGKYAELHGLQLLPLSDGSFRSFTNEEEDTALIDNEEFSRALLPFCKERFLCDDLNSNTIHRLRQMAMTNPDLYKIINLDMKNVASFAKEHLPRDWKETQGHVKWNYAKDGHPPKTWLTEFWKFLNAHWEELNEFIGMPLIPLEPLQKTGSSTLLAKLEKNPTLIFQSSRESTLPDQVQKVVKIVGGTVIKKDECLKHHDVESYVLTTSPKNVLQVLLNTDSDKVVSCIASASLHEKEEFKTYISSMDCISHGENQLLSALPLFRLMSGKYVAVESRQAVILKSNPPIPTDLPVPETTVQCANEADRRLLILLKVDLLDAAQLAVHLVDCIERKAFNKEEEEKIMTWILHHGNVLLSQSEELLRKSRNLSFIETEHGERKQPSSVFDPTNKIFQDLFEEDFFLPQVYRTQVILQSLRQLGLRTKEEEISPTDVLHVVSQIQKLHIHSRNKAFKKADALVGVLNRNDLLSKFSEGERGDLLQMQWVPCENPNSVSSNSKNIQKRGLYKPAEIRASKYFAIVGHVMPLTSELRECVCQKLDLFIPPPAEKVLENLCVLGSMAPLLVNPDSDYEFKNKVHSTYKFIQENTEYFREEMNKKCIAWLWCQNEFVSPRDVVLVYPDELDLSLYIKKVPEEFLQYADMLKEFGVKETLSDEEIEDIFHDIKQSIDDRDPPFGEPSELKVSIAILDWMRKNEKPLKNSTPVPVRAENQNFTLEPLKNTVYCDISDEGLEDLRQDKEEFHVIHEEVLGLTAKWLKVPFLSTRILKPQFIRAEEECPGIEQCGQTEPITQRIKNILKEYDEVSDIFKELIQNAEDAGASTCGFLLDFRTHPPESLIDDGMALCNGPCLWAFNNELFSDEDWKNIVRVGSASKENKIEKIGNFGLGFNAVYHLTDIPSILSGKSLLILDPNVTHLEKHIQSKANPGIKLDLFQERLFRRFPGQFRSYQGIFGCDLTKSSQKYYKGTLIKLPFRTSEEVCKSEISCKVYNKEDIHAFQQHITDDAQSPLLFLKNMNSVSLQIISEDASIPPLETQIQTPLRISKEVVCSVNISNEMHVEDIRNTMENLDSNCHKVVDCFTAHIVQIVYEHVDRISNQYWLIYSCLGTKDSMRMFHRELQECKFSLPIGGVAVPLQKEAENVWSPDESCAVGQAFCFLPLPIDTGLPVHLNGSFAVTSNRKALWQTGTKLEWNKALLQDASATAYITTLLELKKMAQHGNLQNYDFYTFWPDAKKVSKAFQPLVSAFYSAIAQCTTDRSLDLFSNGQSWCSIDKARFLDPEIERNEAVGKLAIKVFLNDTESHYCAVPLPLWVRNSFIQCGFHEVVEERTFHWVEFYQVVFKNLKNMDPHCRNALILNAIDLNDHGVDALLKSNPCIPTQKSDKLQFISKLVNPLGKVACLYDPEEGRFLDGTKNDYFTPRRIQRLSGLGMLSDTLMLEDVVERAKTISRVWTEDQKKVQKCLQCLFACMKEHLYDDRSPHWETLEHISFLPARIIDQDNNLTTRLKKPSEVYSYQYCDLVNMTEFSVDHSNLIIQPNNPVLTKLGVNKTPPVKTVLKQLKEAHDRSDTFEKSLLLNVAKSCYNYLNKYLIDGGDPAAIIDHAQSIPFVLIEGHFVSVGSVAKSGGFEEKPYLYVLPAILSQFENLWNCVGIKNKFTAEQFVAVLQEMSTFPGPLSKSDLHTCLSIVIKGLYDAKVKLGDCLLPDEKGVLTHASKLHYNDSPWMPVQAGVKLCHKLLPRPVACHFGVVTTRHHTLKNHLVDGFCPFTREFGQHEKLTVRIKNIIDAYPSKKDILKELIQNADDAEATEIHFVWDKRQHKTEKIFGEKWKLLQGPALCVYNNKTFTDEDLIGIQQLGEGGKHGTLGRTGKFGLGFNSVYHLTDCPSILTADEKLCVSDPNLKYVESGTKESPGCMYLMDDKFKESFKDVYHTFLPEKFALQSGTMFRFPLRTEEMTKKSEISRHAVTDHEMKELLYALIVDPEGLILFLKHITKLQFHVINADGSEQNAFLIEKKVTESTQEKREGFHNHVRNSLKSGQLIPCQTIYNVLISSGQRQSLWIIAERYGSILQRLEKRGSLSNLKVPQVALAACVGTKPEEAEFTGRAFCSLPLPGETGLPVHVNGNFEVDFSRRDLWKEDAESLRTTWNESLKLKTIAPLYADLLTHLCTNYKFTKTQLLNLVRLLVELRQNFDYGQYRDKIASTLRCVRFIEDIHGCLQMASYFFDDTVNLYKVMLPKERFVPEAFWKRFQNASAGAKSLLEDLGLKHKVSEEEIIGFAHQIESDSRGKTDLDVLKHRSSTLFKFVLQRGAEKNSKLMHRIATIKFIFPVQIESALCVYHKAFAQGRDVVAIKGSLLEKDLGYKCLIWTAMPMLPSIDCSPRHIDALTHAGAFDKPPSEKVMQHLKNICKSLCSTKTLVGIRATVFTFAYAYLQSVDFDASVLAGLPLILTEDDTNLVKASQAVLSLTNPNDFRPYLYPIQGKHAMYAEFFKKIGVEEKPTITQLCTVLQEIHTECCNKTTLQPNQQATVKRAVQQLFCLIQEDSKGATFPKITLYLPSTDGKLYESSTLFFNDTFFQAKRLEDSLKTKLKLLEKLNHCHLGNDHYEHQKLMKLLPQKIRPKLLSQVISEHLVHAQVERCDYRKECEFSGWFENHLSSYAFRHGLICLIREQSNGTVSQTDAAQMCEITFGKIQIICCKALQTELLLYREPLEGTQTETQVYVQKQQGGCTFYLKHSDSMAPKVVNEVTMHLTKEINSLLQNILNSLSLPVLGQLLLCENMEDVERTLEQNGIHNSVSEGEGFGARPSPGSPIPEEWHDSLDMSPLNSFEKGEYVGFRKDESKSEYVFAIIVERLDELPGGTRRNPPRYKIQIGNDEFTEVSALDLYQFKREARAGSDEFIEVSSPDLHQFRRAARSASMTNDTCTEMDIMPKPATASQKRPIPKTLEEVKREIDQSLKEIWNMPPEDKCKALRRLYLRWHPDKNLDNPDLANEAFKYLKNKINELQQGKTKCSTFSSSNDFRDYWSRWNEEARSHRRGRERFYQNNSRQYYNFWSYYRETPRPNREEAKRWYKQAQFDLNAAKSETTGKGSPEWCLFKVHQAVEKALIATEYRRSGRHSGNCSIASLAQQVSCYSTHLRGIPSAVAQLSALGVDAKKTQYPNYHPSPHIPHEQFTFEDARKAVNIATELLTKLCKYITD
ncbi:hypothetical protein SRHO_G00104780 [Serrasalmus rhombeus]